MLINAVLKPTAAAVGALGVAAIPGVVMAETTGHPLVLSFDGVVGTGNHANAYGEAKYGNSGTLDDDVAFVGSVGLSRSINDNWDWSVSVSKLGYTDNAISEGDLNPSVSLVNRSERSDLDFTFGRHLKLGSASARLGLGLAYAKASADKGLDLADIGGDYYNSNLGTEFQGIGPRLSVDVKSAPVAMSGKLSVIGGVEVNLLAGQYQHSKGFEAYDGTDNFADNTQQSSHGHMTTAGIKLGVEYDANENTVFRAGIRHDITHMDQAALNGPFDVAPISVDDQRTSLFVGMDIGF